MQVEWINKIEFIDEAAGSSDAQLQGVTREVTHTILGEVEGCPASLHLFPAHRVNSESTGRNWARTRRYLH
jgi:hypothetical protein